MRLSSRSARRSTNGLQASVVGLALAGDGTGIGGAEAAAIQGRIAGLGCASRLGLIAPSERDRLARPAPEVPRTGLAGQAVSR